MKRLIVQVLLLSSCVSSSIRQDNFAASLDDHYHNVEFTIGGVSYLGVAAVKAPLGGLFVFYVNGYHKGMIRVESEACGISTSFAYFDFMPTRVELDLGRSKRCLLAVSVSPYFDEQEAQGIEWRGMTGVILVKREERRFIGQAQQLRFGDIFWFDANVKSDISKLVLKGCGVKYSKLLIPGHHNISFNIDMETDERICVIEGSLKGRSQDDSLNILLTRHSGTYVKLPNPKIEIKDSWVNVVADHSVSVMNYGLDTTFNSRFSFPLIENGVLRLLTNKGRSNFCIIKSRGEPRCFQ